MARINSELAEDLNYLLDRVDLVGKLASNLISRGLSIEDIKSITGITQEKTIKRYLEVSIKTKEEKLKSAFNNLTGVKKTN